MRVLNLLFILFFVCSSIDTIGQVVDFNNYRYHYIDTTRINKFVKKNKERSALIEKYSKLYLRKHNIEYLYLLNNIADKYFSEKQDDKANDLLFNNITLANTIRQNSFEHAYSYYLLCYNYSFNGNYSVLPKYANLFTEAITKAKVDSAILSLGFSYSTKWNFMARNIERGFADFDISNDIAKKLGLIYILQNNYTNAGNILTFYEPQLATEFLDYAIFLSKSNKLISTKDVVYLYLINGAAYLAIDHFDKALENFKYSLKVMKQDNLINPRFEKALNYYIAVCYKYKHEYSKAIKQLDYFKKGDSYSNDGLQVLGELYFIQQKYDTAKIYLQQLYSSISKNNFNNRKINVLLILNDLAICNSHLGNMEIAKDLFRECLFRMAGDSIISDEKLLPNSVPVDNASFHYWHTFLSGYTKLIQNEYYEGNYSLNQVVSCYFNDINSLNNKVFMKNNIADKYMFSKIAKETSMNLLDFLSTVENIPDTLLYKVWNLVAFCKNNHLNSELSRENTKLNLKTEEQLIYDSLKTQYLNYSKITNNSNSKTEDKLNCSKDIFALSYNKKAELLYPSIELNVSINSVIINLKPNEFIIDYYSNDSNIYFFSYINSKMKFHKVKRPKYVFDAMKSFTRSIKSGDENHGANDKVLIKALGLEMVSKSNQSIYFVPDNNMATFPIEILKNENGKYLIENNNISYLYSMSQLTHKEANINYENEISCFAPGFLKLIDDNTLSEFQRDLNLKPLPYSIKECEQIDSIFKERYSTSLRLNKAATTTNFFKEISSSKILHISTHGTASKNTLNNTGIYLYNDTLGLDFITFDKIKNNSIKTELTVLSACKTAEGVNINGEGKMSLSYGFMFAGSKNVIASLWYVSDKVTQKLMMKFYENINKYNMSYSQALQSAKIYLIHQGYSPLDWGSFIILGKR